MTDTLSVTRVVAKRTPWNKGRSSVRSHRSRPKHVWSIRPKL